VVGYDRYQCQAAWAALKALYIPLRLYLNFFQPVMVLVEKQRNRAKVKKRNDKVKTPYQRVLDAPEVADEAKERLRQLYPSLNPAELLRQIQVKQTALWKLAQQPADASGSFDSTFAIVSRPTTVETVVWHSQNPLKRVEATGVVRFNTLFVPDGDFNHRPEWLTSRQTTH